MDDYKHNIKRVIDRLTRSIERDTLVQETTMLLRKELRVDRVALYYFYSQWRGQVTFESLADERFSILGSTGGDDCFNDEYAELYLAGRVRAIADIQAEPIQLCHREFLESLQVQANLVVPILTAKGLWGLLVAHHCQSIHPWSSEDIGLMQQGAKTLAEAPTIQGS
jgi:GAF domain-containing protein